MNTTPIFIITVNNNISQNLKNNNEYSNTLQLLQKIDIISNLKVNNNQIIKEIKKPQTPQIQSKKPNTAQPSTPQSTSRKNLENKQETKNKLQRNNTQINLVNQNSSNSNKKIPSRERLKTEGDQNTNKIINKNINTNTKNTNTINKNIFTNQNNNNNINNNPKNAENSKNIITQDQIQIEKYKKIISEQKEEIQKLKENLTKNNQKQKTQNLSVVEEELNKRKLENTKQHILIQKLQKQIYDYEIQQTQPDAKMLELQNQMKNKFDALNQQIINKDQEILIYQQQLEKTNSKLDSQKLQFQKEKREIKQNQIEIQENQSEQQQQNTQSKELQEKNLKQQQQIDELKKQNQNLVQVIKNLESKITEQEDIADKSLLQLRQSISVIKMSKLNESNLKNSPIKNQIQMQQISPQKQNQEIQQLKRQNCEYKSQLEGISSQIQFQNEELIEKNQQIQQLETQIKDLQNEINNIKNNNKSQQDKQKINGNNENNNNNENKNKVEKQKKPVPGYMQNTKSNNNNNNNVQTKKENTQAKHNDQSAQEKIKKQKEMKNKYGGIQNNKNTKAKKDHTKGIDQKLVEQVKNQMLSTNTNITFDDIAGLTKIKQLLIESIMWPIQFPDFFKDRKIKLPKGMLMYGPPGNGKSFLAKAVSNLGNISFFDIPISSLTSKNFGDSEKLISALFALAKNNAPSIIFIDEIDAIGGKRGKSNEQEVTLRMKNELLKAMTDSETTESSEYVMILGATNRPWEIDDALLRRLEKRILIDNPDLETRKALLQLKLQDYDESVDFDIVAQKTKGFSGDDLSQICDKSSIIPLREQMQKINPMDMGNINIDDIRKTNMNDIETVLKKFNKALSSDSLKEFYEWEKNFGNS